MMQKNSRLFIFIGLAAFIAVIALAVIYGPDYYSQMKREKAVQAYSEEIDECARTNMDFFINPVWEEEQYGCAFYVASGLYGINNQLAIDLCYEYHPDKDTQEKSVIEAECEANLIEIMNPPESE